MSHLTNVSLIASTNLPLNMKPSSPPPHPSHALSLVVKLTVAPPYLNKGNLPLLRSALLLFCLARTIPYMNHQGSPIGVYVKPKNNS